MTNADVARTKWALPALLTLMIGCGDSMGPNGQSAAEEQPGTPTQEQLPNSTGNNVATSGLATTWVKCVDHRSHKLPNHSKSNPSTIPYSKLKYKIFGPAPTNTYTRVDYYFYNAGCTGEIYAKRQYFGTWSFPGTKSNVNLNGNPVEAQDIDLKILGYWRTYFQTSKGDEARSYDNSHCRLPGWMPGAPRDMMSAHCGRNYGPNKTTYEIVHVSSNQSEGMYFGHTTRAHNGHSVGNRPVQFGSHYLDSTVFTGAPMPPTYASDIVRPPS